MSALATAARQTMTSSPHDLVILNRDNAEWRRHPWQEVHSRAENIAERVLDSGDGDVGLIGEPTVEIVAAIQGAWLAGRAVAILPGPVRGADERQWAAATTTRLTDIGVTQVFSHG
ncbi:MAG: long-chain-fatty-acid--ACP ligase, partial [Actinomycetota bacterium]|nr:long-chain-fatty-acid--ACP ligase [Actinomycetota bacterium]